MAKFLPAIAVSLAAALGLPWAAALAQDKTGQYAGSPDAAWFGRRHNSQGGYCCTGADGHRYYGGYSINHDGSVSITMPSGEEIDIDDGRVLPFNPADPNPTGTAVWWHADDNQRLTWCFALGPLT